MIYLDYNATTPLDPRVLEAMLPWFCEKFGNAASRPHRLGAEARDAVESARAQAAALIGADPEEIVWTSGATESDNLAIKGVAAAAKDRNHLITIATEHRAVLDPCERLEGAGFRCYHPRGAYYVMTDISEFGFPDDTQFVHHLIENVGVAAVPGSSFFEDPKNGHKMVRFCFCKKYETLKEAQMRLRKI